MSECVRVKIKFGARVRVRGVRVKIRATVRVRVRGGRGYQHRFA